MKNRKINVGVVGVGIGATHIRNLGRIPNANIAAIADLDLGKATEFAKEYGANAYPDWRAMLDGQKDLDAVVLATPAKIRREPIEAICQRGLALFCEKPPAVNLTEALEISKIIQTAGILNTVGFMYRWSPLASRFKELVAGKQVLFARGVVAWPVFSWFQGSDSPKTIFSKTACGGPIIEQAIHYQDVLRYISGDEPLQVQAFAELGTTYSNVGRDCEETTAYVLRHASGMLSTHVQNWSHNGSLLQLQLVGVDFDLTWHMPNDDMRLTGQIDGVNIDEFSATTGYYEEMVGFVNAVQQQDQSQLRSPYADACKSMAVCEAANTAVASGQSVAVG